VRVRHSSSVISIFMSRPAVPLHCSMRPMRYALPLVFSFNACKALAKLQLSWGNGGSYQLRRNRDRGDRYLNGPTGAIVRSPTVVSPWSRFFDKGNKSQGLVPIPADAQGHIEGCSFVWTQPKP